MRMRQWALTVALSLCVAAASLQAAPGESLGWLPEETVASFRIDFKKLWRGPLMGDSRRLIQKGGAAHALLQLQMSPRLDEIEEISGGAWPDADGSPAFLVALTGSEPIDGFKAAFTYLGPSAKPVAGAPSGMWESGGFLLAQTAGKEILFGTPEAVKAAVARKKGPPRSGGLLEGQFALRLNRSQLIDALAAAVPEPFGPLAAAKSASLVVDATGPQVEARIVLGFGDGKDADKALEALNAARKMAKPLFEQGRAQIRRELGAGAESDIAQHFGMVMGLGWLNMLEKDLDAVEIQRKGTELSTSVKADIAELNGLGISPLQAGIVAGMLLPAVQKVREAGNRTHSMNNMRMLGLALHNYEASMGQFPPAVVTDKDGKPLYSWRVLILPYIEQDAVYKAWKLDEPWDSPNNRRLSDLVIKTFCEPTEPPTNRTHYRVFHGKGAMFNVAKAGKPIAGGSRIAEIVDGTSNTLMIVQTRDSAPWAAPDDIAYDPQKPLPALGLPGASTFLAGFADGSVRTLKTTIKPQNLHLLIQKSDGNPLPEDFDK